jgi:PiT family inorganic phosphate transporter
LLALAFGVGDAPNATAALVASRTASYRSAVAFGGSLHAVGALVGGSAVALTVSSLVHLEPSDVASVFASAALASVAFTLACARARIPTSASFGLVGGLIGAALVAGGVDAVAWGWFSGLSPTGVLGVLTGMLLSPLVGAVAGAVVDRASRVALRRVSRRGVPGVRGGIWVGSAVVALAGGANDGQKAMGVAIAALAAAGSTAAVNHVPLWVRVSCAVLVAAGTMLGGQRVVRTVSSGIYREGLLEALNAQATAAFLVVGATVQAAPVSASNVVASAVVGVGVDRRPRHVRWTVVGRLLTAWTLTAPACAVLAAGLEVVLGKF